VAHTGRASVILSNKTLKID